MGPLLTRSCTNCVMIWGRMEAFLFIWLPIGAVSKRGKDKSWRDVADLAKKRLAHFVGVEGRKACFLLLPPSRMLSLIIYGQRISAPGCRVNTRSSQGERVARPFVLFLQRRNSPFLVLVLIFAHWGSVWVSMIFCVGFPQSV